MILFYFSCNFDIRIFVLLYTKISQIMTFPGSQNILHAWTIIFKIYYWHWLNYLVLLPWYKPWYSVINMLSQLTRFSMKLFIDLLNFSFYHLLLWFFFKYMFLYWILLSYLELTSSFHSIVSVVSEIIQKFIHVFVFF